MAQSNERVRICNVTDVRAHDRHNWAESRITYTTYTATAASCTCYGDAAVRISDRPACLAVYAGCRVAVRAGSTNGCPTDAITGGRERGLASWQLQLQ